MGKFKELAKTQRPAGATLHGIEWDWGTYVEQLDEAVVVYRKKQTDYGFDVDNVTAEMLREENYAQ